MQAATSLSSGTKRQQELEKESAAAGIARYRERAAKHASRGSEGDADYGHWLIGQCIEPHAKAIREFIAEAYKKPGRRHIAVKHLEQIDAELAAFITARSVIDGVSQVSRLQRVALMVGGRVSDEMRLAQFKEDEPDLFHKVNRRIDESPRSFDSGYRRDVLTHAANKFDIAPLSWSRTEKFHVGACLIDLFIKATGLVREHRLQGIRKTEVYLKAADELAEHIERYKARSELLSPFFMPMVCPPKPWTTLKDGGYLTDPLRRKLVKGDIRELRTRQMPKVYEAVNALQATPWAINRRLLAAARAVRDAGREVDGFPPREPYPLPPKPANFETNPEAKRLWKLRAADIHRLNLKLHGKRLQTAKLFYLAGKFEEYPAIWFPLQLDFRGRIYPIPQYLHAQGCDLAKGLLTFAEGKPLGRDGARWLAIHLANTYGYDKCSLDDRERWAREHSARIAGSANDPLSDRFWMDADKPFQFLAAAIDWEGYLRESETYVSSLPIMVDGSCNGLQHFSAMLRDEVCGAEVNLAPLGKPADIYTTVAEELKVKLRDIVQAGGENANLAEKWLAYGIDRKLCKHPVMVLPYGGTRSSFADHVRDAVFGKQRSKLQAQPLEGDECKAVQFLTPVLSQVMDAVVVGPRKVMKWLKSIGQTVGKTRQPVCWTTPTGFYVAKRYMCTKLRRVKTTWGDGTIKLSLAEETDKLDIRKQTQSLAANFVHSLDAAALVFTICLAKARGLDQFAAVHDSYGTLAADMQTLLDSLRESFVRMYEENDVLERFRVEVGAVGHDIQLPPAPKRGQLDLGGVLKSDFFFA